MENMEIAHGVEVLQGGLLADIQPIQPPFGMDWRTWFDFKAKLGKKKSAVMAAVERIPKNGFNKEHNYKFAQESDINEGLRKILNENNLDFDVELVREWQELTQRNAPITKVELRLIWVDCETGYFESRRWIGTGLDYTEKGIYKAYTGGIKYYLMKTFLIPTGDDPERDNQQQDHTQQNGQQNGPQRGANSQGVQSQGQGHKNGQNGQNSQRRGANKQTEEKPPQNADEGKKEEGQTQSGQAPDDQSNHDAAVTSDQVGKIKVKILTLAAFSDDKNKKKAEEAVHESLRVKLGVKFAQVSDLTAAQAAEALKYLDGWIQLREEKKRKQQEGQESQEKQDGEVGQDQQKKQESEGK